MHGVSCVDVCVNMRGSACTVLFTHACAPVGLHTAYIHTLKVVHYIHGRCTSCELCGVCAHVYGRDYVHGFFSYVCTAHVLSHTGVRAWAPKSHRGSARVGWHAGPREGGARTHLPRKSCTRRMCAFATACTRDEGTKKTGTRQRLNVFRWKAG